MLTLVTTVSSQAAPAAVVRLLLTGVSWPLWSPVETFTLERDGHELSGWTSPERVVGTQVVGDVRVFGTGRRVERHRITDVVPDSSLSFERLGGALVRTEQTVVVTPARDRGSTVEWHTTLRHVPPGGRGVLARASRRRDARFADGLAEFAAGYERRAAAAAPDRSSADQPFAF